MKPGCSRTTGSLKLAKRISSILSDRYSADCAEDQGSLTLSAAARLISNNGVITHHLEDGRSVRQSRQFLGCPRLKCLTVFHDQRTCRQAVRFKIHPRAAGQTVFLRSRGRRVVVSEKCEPASVLYQYQYQYVRLRRSRATRQEQQRGSV